MDLRRFDLNLLVVLDALLEERGVSAAARRLGVSQPNVSFALSKLRAQLDDALLIRDGNRMEPTVLAQELRAPLRRILDTVRHEVLSERAFDPLQAKRRFVISMSDIGELVFLPSLMEELRRIAPGVSLDSRSLSPGDLEQAMAQGEIDLALGYFPDIKGSNFLTRKLFEHPFICIAAANNDQAHPNWTLEQFLRMGHIVVAQHGRSQELFEERLRELGLSRDVYLQSPHFMSVPLLVAQSDLISTVPEAVGAIFATMAPLRLIEPPLILPRIELKQFWHRRAHDDPGLRWLRDVVTRLFQNRDPSPSIDVLANKR